MKKKVLIINKSQFGYHIDYYYYCKYLKDHYEITYLCWDYQKEKIELEGVEVIYTSRSGSKLKRYLRFLFRTLLESRNNYDLYFLKYFLGCSLLKLCSRNKKYIFDVRSSYIISNVFKRHFLNKILYFESLFFDRKTIISESLASLLKIDNVHILPLGSEMISETKKSFNELKLLYVGTLKGRKIEQTILGFEKFYKEYKDLIRINYQIIGSGYKQEEEDLLRIVKQKGLNDVVQILGAIPHGKIKPYFDFQNVGVSFIPMTEYFDCQPPTKTFEYILSGMPVIATDTAENRKIVNVSNGILINDDFESFYRGLKFFLKTKDNYDSESIRDTCRQFSWGNIVNNNLLNYLRRCEAPDD